MTSFCRYYLAICYWEGVATNLATGVLQDFKIALKLFKEAFDGGEEQAGELSEMLLEKNHFSD